MTNTPTWVSAKELTPPVDVDVLVYYDSVFFGEIYTIAHFTGDEWVELTGGEEIKGVLFWMYLPPKPL